MTTATKRRKCKRFTSMHVQGDTWAIIDQEKAVENGDLVFCFMKRKSPTDEPTVEVRKAQRVDGEMWTQDEEGGYPPRPPGDCVLAWPIVHLAYLRCERPWTEKAITERLQCFEEGYKQALKDQGLRVVSLS